MAGKVVSVSLGSSRRDDRVEATFLGKAFEISRVGMDGDIDRAEKMIRELDGKVAAIGLGGIDINLVAKGERYVLRDGLRLKEAARVTPVVDGGGLKDTLEREAVRHLAARVTPPLLGPPTPVLMVCALDRFGMAEALVEAGCPVVFGDLIFTMGMSYPIRSLEELAGLAKRLLPEMAKLPFNLLYPTGKEQEKPSDDRFSAYFQEATVVAGDYHYIRKYLPPEITGKTILTQTITAADVEDLRRRGAAWLVTTTPALGGRSYATNVMEALLVAILGKQPEEIAADDYFFLLRQLGFVPRIEKLN